MALTPEQALNLATFTEFQSLIELYIDEFLYLVLFDPINPLVRDFVPTAAERTFIVEVWNDQRPAIKKQLGKIIRLRATTTLNTSGEAIRLVRAGAPGTVTAIYNIFKSEIPNLAATSSPLS